MSEWKKELCSERPDEFQQISDNSYLQRKDIVEAPPKEDGTPGGWECLSKKITKKEYDALMDECVSLAIKEIREILDIQSGILAETQLNTEYITCLQEMTLEN